MNGSVDSTCRVRCQVTTLLRRRSKAFFVVSNGVTLLCTSYFRVIMFFLATFCSSIRVREVMHGPSLGYTIGTVGTFFTPLGVCNRVDVIKWGRALAVF